MFVRWNEKGTKIIDLTRTMRDTQVVDTPKGPAEKGMVPNPKLVKVKTRRETIMLGPGINEISENEWLLAKPHILRELKAGLVKVERHRVSARKAKEGEFAQTITDLSVDAAIALVGQVGPSQMKTIVPNYGNRDTLYRWLALETRTNVNEAIYTRLRFLGLLSEEDARNKKPIQQELAVARALVAEEQPLQDVPEEDYIEDAEPAIAE